MPRFLLTLPFFTALKGYTLTKFKDDMFAGLTVGMIAVPLSMALAINSGVPPQHGLYTAIVAGILIAICGGSKFNVSGPTAAFVVILQPITNQYGVEGLMLASLMAGILLFIWGVFKVGSLVHFVPQPVTTGFSVGIAVVIAITQIPDLLGVEPLIPMTDFVSRLRSIGEMVGRFSLTDLSLGVFTLLGLIFFPFLTRKVPPHLIVLAGSAVVGLFLEMGGFEFRTIKTVFSYEVSGETFWGIPPFLPELRAPWIMKDGTSILTFEMVAKLLPSAFVIAILGAIESLLCAVIADGMKNTRHNPDAELVGQGVGNIVAPFFGGFAATGALARTAASIRAGAQTPLAVIIHGVFVLLTLIVFAKYLGYLPMASLGALLLMVAWSMADVRYLRELTRLAPRADRLVLYTCLTLTVVFDMVIAVAVGMVLASLLFMARMSKFTEMIFLNEAREVELKTVSEELRQWVERGAIYSNNNNNNNTTANNQQENGQYNSEDIILPEVLHYKIRGPFFFGAARKAIESFDRLPNFSQQLKVMVIYLGRVPFMDLSGMIAFRAMLEKLEAQDINIILVELSDEMKAMIGKAGYTPRLHQKIHWVDIKEDALKLAKSLCDE